MNGKVVPIRVIGHDSIVTVTRVTGYDSSHWNDSSSYRLDSKSIQGIYYGDSMSSQVFKNLDSSQGTENATRVGQNWVLAPIYTPE